MPVGRREPLPFRPLVVSIALVALSGCATILAPSADNKLSVESLQPGMSRVQVEAQLGAPALNIKPEFSTGAARKCEYVYLTRDQISKDASTFQLVRHRMTGFTDHRITVYYDRADRVIRIERPGVRSI